MSRFFELDDASTWLGITPEKLVEMRSNGDIHGYRDGGSWKFKSEEIDRVAAELADGGSSSADDDMFSFDSAIDDIGESPKEDSILVSEQELGDSAESTSSTIIGKLGEEEDPDSDLMLSDDSDLQLGDEVGSDSPSDVASISSGLGSAVELEEEASILGSSLKLSPEDSDIESDVALVPGTSVDSDVSLVPDPGSSGILAADSGLGSELELASGTGGDTGNLPELGSDSSSSGDMELGSELALSDDDDMVLGGSDTGSDLALGAGDSGISLGSPSDSGLSLEADSGISLQSATDSGLSLEEDSVEFGGSSISSLELPEDEELVSLDDAEEIAPVQKDPEFMLSPSDEMLDDESDSGSQVIALEDSEAFDQDAAAMLQEASPGQALLAETAGLEAQLDAFSGGGTPATPMVAPGAAPAYAPVGELNEAPYSIWNLLGLMAIMLFLSVSGVLMMDIVRNMWAWEEARDVSTSISDGLTGAFGMKK